MSDVTVRLCRGDEVGAVLHLWRDAEAVPSATDDPPSVRALALVISEQGSAVGFWEAVGYVRDARVGRFAKTLGER